MTDDIGTTTTRTGAAAVAAGVLLFAAVGAELVRPVQRPDGSVTDLTGFVVHMVAWALGAAALLLALRGLGDRCAAGPLPRAGRIGRTTCLAGAVLLLAFPAVALATALVDGRPAEWPFLLFALGMLLFLPGGVALGLGLRRSSAPRGAWIAPLVAAAGVLVALAASADPWHDLGLFTFDAAWVALGYRLLTAAGRTREPLGPERAPLR